MLIDTDAGVFYTKLRGAAQAPSSLVAEVIVGALADALGLAVPARVLIDMNGAAFVLSWLPMGVFVACAAGAFLNAMSNGQPLRLRFEAFASELQLDEEERFTAAAIIGVRLPEERDLRNANEQVGYALASRSLVRRARKSAKAGAVYS